MDGMVYLFMEIMVWRVISVYGNDGMERPICSRECSYREAYLLMICRGVSIHGNDGMQRVICSWE